MGEISGRARRTALLGTAVGALLSFALVGTSVSPSWAAAPERGDPTQRAIASALVDDLTLGGGAVARIDERTGALSVEVPVGGVGLRWDSSAGEDDRHGLGVRWSWADLGHVEVLGGVRATTPTGRIHAADPTSTTGLRGYDVADVLFTQDAGTVPARDDVSVPARESRFALAELGGVETVFGHDGDPLTRRDRFDNRTDWIWDEVVPHRLLGSVDAVGVVSTVDRSVPGSVVVTTTGGDPGADGPGERDGGDQVFTIEQSGGRVESVEDPTGGRTWFGYTDDGLLERVSTPTGAATEIAWRTHPDGTLGAERVRISDGATGEVLTTREWRAVRGAASGWPHAQDFTTMMTDGTTAVESTYTPTGLLNERALSVTTASGTAVVERNVLRYPGMEDGVHLEPEDLPARFTRPASSTRTWYTTSGAERSVAEHSEHDEFGRVTRHTAGDGAVSETEYDSTVADDRRLPVGLPTLQRTTAPDGLVEQTEYELNADRTAVVAEQLTRSPAPGDPPVRTARTEFVVDPDGFVRSESVFPQGGVGTPVVTDRTRIVDPAAGTETVTETKAAGTPSAATTTQIMSLIHDELVAETDASGATTRIERDAAGRELTRIDPAGIRLETLHRTAQHDGANTVTTVRADGLATTERFDPIGRLVRRTDNLSAGHPLEGHTRLIESREYPDAATERVTDAWGATTTTRRDAQGRIVEIIRPTGLHEITGYDDAANTRTMGITPTGRLEDAPMTVTERLGFRAEVTQTTSARADARPTLTTDRGYDGLGRERTVDDGVTTTNIERDAHGKAVSTTIARAGGAEDAEPAWVETADDDVTVTRAFDVLGTSVEQTLSRGDESRSGGIRVVDELGRTTSETDQTGRTTVMEYTPDGLLGRRTTAYDQVTEHTYEPGTRRLVETVVTSPVGDAVRTRSEFDAVLGTVTAVFDPADRGRTEIAYVSDAHGNPTRIGYPDGSVIAHRYDEHGRRIGTTDVAGADTAFGYDAAGRLTSVVQRDAAGVELARVETSFDRFGRLATLTRGNGVVSRFEYTSAGEIASEHTTDASGGAVSAREYEYDSRGNLLSRTDRVREPGAGTEAGALVATRTTYTYDMHDRLRSSTVAELDGVPGEEVPAETSVLARTEYEATVSGDIRTERIETRVGGAQTTTVGRGYSYAPTGELVRVATTTEAGHTVAEQTHDEAGNLIVDVDGTRFAYNAANRQVAETSSDGATITTRYWADGRRAELAAAEPGGAATTRFYWDGATLVNDVHGDDAAGVRAASYLLGASRHARTVMAVGQDGPGDTDARAGAGAARTEYAVHDRHGNVTALTAADGAVTQRYTYDDYGDAFVLTPDPERGAGGTAGAPMRWRVGDADANPFGYAGEYTDPTGTQHLQTRTYHSGIRQFTTADTEPLHNRYAYADLNPITNIDPTGRSSELDGIDWAGLMQEPWFKVLSTALAVVLTIVSFFSMNTPGIGATTAFFVGYYGGMASGAVQAIGATLLAADTLNSFVDEPFWQTDYAGQVQFAGTVLSSVGAIAGGAFRIARKIGVDAMKLQIATLTTEKATLDAEKALLVEQLKIADPKNPLLRTMQGTDRLPTSERSAAALGITQQVEGAPPLPGANSVTTVINDADRASSLGLQGVNAYG